MKISNGINQTSMWSDSCVVFEWSTLYCEFLDKLLKKLEGLVYGDSLLLGPTLKNLLSYDYMVYSKMKFHDVATIFLHLFPSRLCNISKNNAIICIYR